MEIPSLKPLVFVGLGNPGPQYAMTRHNIGYLVVKALAEKWGWHWKEDKHFNALVTKGIVGEAVIHLVQPLTFMNLSGVSVRRYLDYYKLPISSLVIVADDIALDFGKLRLRTMGSPGGHNGLKSVQAYVGTPHYMRLRMGVGHHGEQNLADYVLDPFRAEEMKNLKSFIDRGVEVLQRLIKENVEQVMNAVNTVTKPPLQG